MMNGDFDKDYGATLVRGLISVGWLDGPPHFFEDLRNVLFFNNQIFKGSPSGLVVVVWTASLSSADCVLTPNDIVIYLFSGRPNDEC